MTPDRAIFPANVASGKVMSKLGLSMEGLLTQDFFKNGKFHDMFVYGLTRANYRP